MRLQGRFMVETSPQTLLELLTSLEKIAMCLPGKASYTLGENGLRVRLDDSPVGGGEIEVAITSIDSNSVGYKFKGRIEGVSFDGRARIRITPHGEGYSRVSWEADMELAGILGLLGFLVDIEGIAGRVVEYLVKTLSSCTRQGQARASKNS